MARPVNKPVKLTSNQKVNSALTRWTSLHKHLPKLTIEELQLAIETEKANAKRSSFLQRLVQRLSALHRNELRKEVLGK